MSFGELEALALGLPTAAAIEVDEGDPYPNRARALALAEAAGVSSDALVEIRHSVLKDDDDQPTKWWRAQILGRDVAMTMFVSSRPDED